MYLLLYTSEKKMFIFNLQLKNIGFMSFWMKTIVGGQAMKAKNEIATREQKKRVNFRMKYFINKGFNYWNDLTCNAGYNQC